jgi:hypothetical protein
LRRHLIGIALAVGMMLALYFGAAWGYLRLLRLPAPPVPVSGLPAGGGSLLSNGSVLLSLVAVVGTGLLAGILIGAPRISPLAAGLPGLLLIAWTALYLTSVQRAVNLIPLKYHAFGAGFEAMLFNGLLGAAGLAMIFPLFVPSRWRALDTEADSAVLDAEAKEFVSSLEEAPQPASPGRAERVPSPATARQPTARQPTARQPTARQPSNPSAPWPTQAAPTAPVGRPPEVTHWQPGQG